MEAIINGILERNLTDFSGAQITGQLLLSDELINELIQMGLKEVKTIGKVAKSPLGSSYPTPRPTNSLDLQDIIDRLTIKQLTYSAQEGHTAIDVSAVLL